MYVYTSIEINLYFKHLFQLHVRFFFVDCINQFNNNFLMTIPVVPELR